MKEASERLRVGVQSGTIEEVVLAVPDLGGRLLGQRLDARHFLDEVVAGGMGACVYLLAVDAGMRPFPGAAIDAEALGYGDLHLRPDLGTLRPLPWDPGAVLVIADATIGPEHTPVEVAPRTVLKRQLDRLGERGMVARAGVEYEFLLFPGGYAQAHARGYRGLEPASRANSDYALTGLEALDPVVRRLRTEMRAAGLRMESARGEVHRGQYEIVFRHADAMSTCDDAVFYKTGARQIAAQEGAALTFLAKYDEGEGNSGHVHLSLHGPDGSAFAGGTGGMSDLMRHFVAGQLACMREFALLMAPHVNSWKRLAPGAFAPTAIAWGPDNRLCPVRVVGRDESLRFEHRVPGADANPYLSVAAIVAAGLHGIEHELPLEPPTAGPPAADRPRLPASLHEAVELWEGSAIAEAAFGADVVAHLAAAARGELAAFGRHVTDWELEHGFERY